MKYIKSFEAIIDWK